VKNISPFNPDTSRLYSKPPPNESLKKPNNNTIEQIAKPMIANIFFLFYERM